MILLPLVIFLAAYFSQKNKCLPCFFRDYKLLYASYWGKLVELSRKGKFYLGLKHLKALQTEIHLERNSLTKIDKQKPQLKNQEMRKGSI